MIIMLIAFVIQTSYLIIAAPLFNNISYVILFYSIVCSLFKIIEGVVLKKMCNLSIGKDSSLLLVSIVVFAIWIVRSMFRVGIL